MYKNKKILITGGTGSLGYSLTERLLKTDVESIRILSRNETKQVSMQEKLNDSRIRYFIGDIRDHDRLVRAFEDVDIIFHAAALKHVPIIEYNPFEAIKTNILGSQNVIDAALKQNVDKVICIGTDKSVSPVNTYGATKLLMEKLFVTAMNYFNTKNFRTKFVALRYGNVLGSSGSVIPKFLKQIKERKKITITDPQMTRYSLTMNEALDFILESTKISHGSEVFIPRNLKAYSIMDIKEALEDLCGKVSHEIINIRAGEKLHETLLNIDEIRYSWELRNKYVVFNGEKNQKELNKMYPGIKKIGSNQNFASDKAIKMTKNEIKQVIINTGLLDNF